MNFKILQCKDIKNFRLVYYDSARISPSAPFTPARSLLAPACVPLSGGRAPSSRPSGVYQLTQMMQRMDCAIICVGNRPACWDTHIGPEENYI